MPKLFVLIVSMLIISNFCYGQTYSRVLDIQVIENDRVLLNGFMGGLNAPVLQFGDVNNDNKADLVVYDRSTERFHVFLNKGGNGEIKYVYTPKLSQNFPRIEDWFVLQDYNCDGIIDLFTYGAPSSIAVFQGNFNGAEIEFKSRYNEVRWGSGSIAVFSSPTEYPAIVDLNGDGDLDIVAFSSFSSRVRYYENLQKERRLDCDSLFFERQTDCWGNFEESGIDEMISLNVCDGSFRHEAVNNSNLKVLHSGGSISVVDPDNDGIYDALIGDIASDHMIYLTNGGTKESANMTSQDAQFPSYNVPIEISSSPVAVEGDVDNDGVKDLLVTPFVKSNGDNYNNVWFYKNDGVVKGVELEFESKNFLTQEMIDVGKNAVPTLGDINGDGLLDLIIGNNGLRSSNSETDFTLSFYKNVGDSVSAQFELVTKDYLEVSTAGLRSLAPELGDIDGDGDLDLIIGQENGKIRLHENKGTDEVPNFIFIGELSDDGGNIIDIGSNAVPEFLDFDGDGELDLFIGKENGSISYYRNIGSHVFKLELDNLGGITFNNSTSESFSAPEVGDFDGDGLMDLLVGGNADKVEFYSDIKADAMDNFVVDQLSFFDRLNHTRIALTSGNLGDDGAVEIITGLLGGGLAFFSSEVVSGIRTNIFYRELGIYPNPVKDQIRFALNDFGKIRSIDILSINGVLIKTISIEAYNSSGMLSVADLPRGVYFVSLTDGETKWIGKFIKV